MLGFADGMVRVYEGFSEEEEDMAPWEQPVKSFEAFTNATLVAEYTVDDTDPSELQNGVPVTGLSGGPSEMLSFHVNVPAGSNSLTITTTGDNGDADLYVREGEMPSKRVFDCRSWTSNSSEACALNVQEGTYHIMIRAWDAYTNLSIVADLD